MTARIFITGGASGLGRAIAVRFARAGWRVCIADLNDARGAGVVAALSGAAESAYLHCDVTREEDLLAAARHLERTWGGVDVVVNNAGVASAGAVEDVSIVLPHPKARRTWLLKRLLPRGLYAAIGRLAGCAAPLVQAAPTDARR